jgi:hypothetical protein
LRRGREEGDTEVIEEEENEVKGEDDNGRALREDEGEVRVTGVARAEVREDLGDEDDEVGGRHEEDEEEELPVSWSREDGGTTSPRTLLGSYQVTAFCKGTSLSSPLSSLSIPVFSFPSSSTPTETKHYFINFLK